MLSLSVDNFLVVAISRANNIVEQLTGNSLQLLDLLPQTMAFCNQKDYFVKLKVLPFQNQITIESIVCKLQI